MFREPHFPLLSWVLLLIVAAFLPSLAHAAQSATLNWNSTTDPAVIGYRLYYGNSTGNYPQQIDVGNTSTATVSNLNSGTTYYFVVTAYDNLGLESSPSNEASFTTQPVPTVSLTGVNNGASFNATAPITLGAAASETGGSIAKVDFYQDSKLIAEVSAAPYSLVWNNAPTGTHVLTAVAYDSGGRTASSTQLTITVVPFGVTATQRLSNGSFQMTVAGAIGKTNNIYVSSDLKNWNLLSSAVNSTGTLVVNDPAAAGTTQRFYKVSAN